MNLIYCVMISCMVILANYVTCYHDYDYPSNRRQANRPLYYAKFGEFAPPKTRPPKVIKPKRRPQTRRGQSDEWALTAMARSAIEGVTRFGKGAIGMSDVFEDWEDKSQERFTGEVANYGNLPREYLTPNRRGDRPRSSYQRRRRFDDYQDDSYDNYPDYGGGNRGRGYPRRVRNYESAIGNIISSAYDGAVSFGKGTLGIGRNPNKFDYNRDYGDRRRR